ncbi:MAG: iron chelate uptake ABC transporter family permease subunit [Candidatus Methanomethylophilaceae archaeon]
MKVISIITVSMLLCISVIATSSAVAGTDADDDIWVLFDEGNGDTTWVSVQFSGGDTVNTLIAEAADEAGLEYVLSGSTVTVDGKTSDIVGSSSSGGSLVVSGTTGRTVTSTWHLYVCEEGDTSWTERDISESLVYTSGDLALGFYPDGIVPTETPEYRSSWTMVRGDAALSGEQDAVLSSEEPNIEWTVRSRAGGDYVTSTVLVAGNYAYVGFGGGYTADSVQPRYYCFDRFTGETIWTFEYEIGAGYETASALIAGDYIFIPATEGKIYRIPLVDGPGVDNVNVLSISIPFTTEQELTGEYYSTGPSTLIFDSGVIYLGSSSGMVYCFNCDLELIWSYQTEGCVYYSPPTVTDDYLFMGALNGELYVLDKQTGSLITDKEIYVSTSTGEETGLVSPVVMIGDVLFFSFSDGRGMSTATGGLGIYTFDGTTLTEVKSIQNLGLMPTYLIPVDNDDFTGVYFISSNGLYRVDADGNCSMLNDSFSTVKAGPVLVNGQYIYMVEYRISGLLYKVDLNGKILATTTPPAKGSSYCMSSLVIIDDWIYNGNDGCVYAVSGGMTPVVPTEENTGLEQYLAYFVIAGIIILFAAVLLYLRFVKKEKAPLASIGRRLADLMGLNDPELSHTQSNKRRLLIVIAFGSILAFVVFMLCLAYGPSGNMSLSETLRALISSIQKSGRNLDFDELIVYESRLPRALAAFAVGVGLSIAGAVYQAIIRNPLVDPYIMGVSAGAGTAAIAVIAFDFTFFGLFASQSIYLTALAAMVGGVIAFFATMLIAEKSGGSSTNYVLAGVIIGLAFSAVQSLMLSMAGHKVTDALSWLFGSFANISWTNAWLVIIPALALSIVPLFWAKELNLVLLGEDEAKQMGLDVRKFNRWMLILASVLTAICVAFVGIIGFVGLVIPHLCRMILGGDHRLVLPASMVLGGSLMMMADFAAKMLMVPTELPVGAITTIIGVPVFAYLLIKKGRMYDG